MKIALLSTFEQTGGAAIACKRLNKALRKHGVESTMLVQNNAKVAHENVVWLQRMAKRFSKIRLAIDVLQASKYLKDKKFRFAFSPATAGVDVAQYDVVKEADVVHLHWINQGFVSLNSLERLAKLNKPIVWTLHDMWAFTGGCHHSRNCEAYKKECGNCWYLKAEGANDFSHKIWERKKEIFAQLNLSVVTCSTWLANCAKSSSLLGNRTIKVIPNPIDVSLYSVAEDKKVVRQKMNLPQDKFIISMSAFNVTDERKGFKYLQDALVKIANENPALAQKIHVVLIGDNKNPSVIQLPVSYSVTGYINDAKVMQQLYQSSDVFALPSLEENLPNTIMEALACGIPSLAFDVGGISDLIDHKENGYLAKYLSVDDLVCGIEWLFNQPDEGKKLSNNARKKVEEKFELQKVALQYEDLYKSLI